MRPLSTSFGAVLLVLVAALAGCSSDGPTDPAQGIVAGTVTSPELGPLAEVTVSAAPGGLSGMTAPVTGEYAIDGLTPGDYTLALGELPEGCVDPGSQSTTVAAGETATVDFTVACASPDLGTVIGTVTSPDLGALGDVTITASPGGLSGVSDAGTGEYDIPSLTPGEYTLALTALPAGCIDPGSQPATVTAGGATTVDFTVECLSGNIYVSSPGGNLDANRVTVHSAGASGNVSPTATIAGPSTDLNSAWYIALDEQGQLYAANSSTNSITVYAAGASDDASPIATIAGNNTGLDSPLGLVVDAEGQLYVVNTASNSITVYAAGATGNATPVATIEGPATGLDMPQVIAIDENDQLFVANLNLGVSSSITVYAAGATGDASPIATIAGPNTGLDSPLGIASDGNGRIYVANFLAGPGNVTVFDAGATGDASPIATIAGPSTGLDAPIGLALDDAGRLFVTNAGGNSITVYPADATGNVSPITTIAGPATLLDSPNGIALGP
jgi:sugar lactone lactonase YvrE